MSIVLGSGDLVSIILAGGIAAVLRNSVGGGVNYELYIQIAPLGLVFVLLFALSGLYPGVGLHPVDEFRRLEITTTMGFLSLIAVSFLAKSSIAYSRAVLIIAWGLALFFIPLGRVIVKYIFIQLRMWGEPVAIIGENIEDVDKIINHLRSTLRIGLYPIVYFKESVGDINNLGYKNLQIHNLNDFHEICSEFPIKYLLIAMENWQREELERLEYYHGNFERVILVTSGHGHQRLQESVIDYGGMTGFEIKRIFFTASAQGVKRIMDIGLSLGLIIILSPIFLIIAILIKIDSQGTVFFRQKRIGKNGEPFKLLKFRTMFTDAELIKEEYLMKEPALMDEWNKFQKIQNDPRITRIGNFLRKFSLDEFPQLWNVLIGEMSLIGPRPFLPEQQELYGSRYSTYIRFKPGMTGMWQVSGRSAVSFVDRGNWDNYYFHYWSIWLDLYILARTIPAVIRQGGAY
jgi:Undecaprenyl-phosphate galactose phosphotransferase WbaP